MMSAFRASSSTGAGAGAGAGMTRKDVTCDYCDRLIRDCMCVTAPTHGRYCDDCGRARPYCICGMGLCVGCDKKTDACVCDKCRACTKRVDDCVCPCKDCKYPGNACRCYEEEERDPDECPRCYSNPCECEKLARQKDLNREATVTCSECGFHSTRCQCGRPEEDD